MRIALHAIAAAVVLAAGCGSHGTSSAEAPASGAAIPAAVATADLAPAPQIREVTGTVRSVTTSDIQSKTAGYVIAVHVNAGQTVESGALLAEIDSRDADAQLRSMNAGLLAARRALDEAAKAEAAAQSSAKSAGVRRDLAKTTFDRQSKLLGQKAISQQTFDEADAAWRSADAEARVRTDEAAVAQAKRQRAAASVDQALAAFDAAKTGLSYTHVSAPYAGLITSKRVDVGDLASPGKTLFILEDRSAYRLEAGVDESTIAYVHANDSVEVSIDGTGGEPLHGTVAEVVPAADPVSRTSLVKISLPRDATLRSGQFGRARFTAGESTILAVPRAALAVRGQLQGLFVLDEDGVARLRLVKTGGVTGDRIEILSGLSAGDRYVAEVTPDIADGVRIAVR